MAKLIDQRCFNHSLREAAARCPECGRCFCRECVTEHEDRLICAACLRRMVKPRFTQRGFFVFAVRVVQFGVGLFAVWMFFYLLGETLARIPSPFHEDSVWQGDGWDEP